MVCSAVEKYKDITFSKGYFYYAVQHPGMGSRGLAQRSGVPVFRPLPTLDNSLAWERLFLNLSLSWDVCWSTKEGFFVLHFLLLKLTEDHTWKLKVQKAGTPGSRSIF